MVVLGSSPEDLQNSLDNLYNYCNTWSLSVNTDKTKIVAFRKRSKLKGNEHWFNRGKKIEVVNDFNYLGVVFICFYILSTICYRKSSKGDECFELSSA